jgi:hypothetical protein
MAVNSFNFLTKNLKTVPVRSASSSVHAAFHGTDIHKLFTHLNVTINFWDVFNERAKPPQKNAFIYYFEIIINELANGIIEVAALFSNKNEKAPEIAQTMPEIPFSREQKPLNQALVVETSNSSGERICQVILIDTKESAFFARKILEENERQESRAIKNKIAIFDLNTLDFTYTSKDFSLQEIEKMQSFNESICEAMLIQSIYSKTFQIFDQQDSQKTRREHLRSLALQKVQKLGNNKAFKELQALLPPSNIGSDLEQRIEEDGKIEKIKGTPSLSSLASKTYEKISLYSLTFFSSGQ